MSAENTKPVQKIRLAGLDPAESHGRHLLDRNLDLIRNVKVNLTVTAGRCELSVKELFDLKENSVLALDKSTRDPVDVMLDGKVVARGTLVAVGDSFGVRISEIAVP